MLIPTISPNTGAQDMFQNLRNKRQSNILANNFELSESPVSFNVSPLIESSTNNVSRSPPQSIQALQSQTNTLLGQGSVILEQNRDIDVRNANTVAALNFLGNQSSTGANEVRELQRLGQSELLLVSQPDYLLILYYH